MTPTAAESTEQPPQRQGWGGSRRGAGRRPRDVDKWVAARGLKPASAAEILDRADERRIWYRLLHSEDEGVVLRAVTYLTDRRDGRAAQQINVTSVGVQFSPEQIERARAVVRELMQPGLEAHSPQATAPTLEGECVPEPKGC
ncbi:MAG: hypothetical protein ACRD3L_10825 [Terriglobales bacterium]